MEETNYVSVIEAIWAKGPIEVYGPTAHGETGIGTAE